MIWWLLKPPWQDHSDAHDPIIHSTVLFAMIDPEERFLSTGQHFRGDSENPATYAFCNIWDFDQLRWIKVKGTAQVFPPEKDLETSIFAQFADSLSPEIRAVTVNNDGLLTGVSTDPKEDDSLFVGYIPISICPSLAECSIIYFSQLRELDRLGPGVDLVSYDDQRLAFKFNPLAFPGCLSMFWKEMTILIKLPPHPNLMPFDRVVLEDVESRVIGFTTKFIPGGTLADADSKRPFRFEWLQQLIQLVDFLNLELGIMHQDIAPRNLLVHPETDKIILFDFGYVANRKEDLLVNRDDVSGVVFTLYEIVTKDTQHTKIPHWERNIDMVQNIEWTCRGELDSDASKFRKFLNEWVAKRAEMSTKQYFNTPRLTWPDLPDPPEYSVPFELGRTEKGEIMWQTGLRSTRIAREKGHYCFQW